MFRRNTILSLSEFDIIARYFNRPGLAPRAGEASRVPLAIGDDCALIAVPPGACLAVSMDILVSGVHFPAGTDPARVGRKALAVNLSDLAAMGAEPVAFTLGLTLPEVRHEWLEGFSRGLEDLAARYGCPLIGGDVTRGNLAIAIQVHGYVERNKALYRSTAKPGELVYVSGTLGDAGLGLEFATHESNVPELQEAHKHFLEHAYYEPEPRVDLGRRLGGVASAAIDVSDGLLADLGHIAESSGVGINVRTDQVPLSPALEETLGRDRALPYALTAGDDYELAFCVPAGAMDAFHAVAGASDIRLTRIGEVVEGKGVTCLNETGEVLAISPGGYRHF